MGFWQGMMKMVQGKPVFEAPAGTKEPTPPPEASQYETTHTPQAQTSIAPPPPPPTTQQPHVTPTFTLTHCKSDINGNNIEVTAWLTNTSTVDIEIDKCVILDHTTEINRRLSPGGAHQAILYRGPIPTTDHAHKANIFYKSIHENEYCRADFMVEYNREPDGTYTVEELHPEHYAIKVY
ncbi:MAG: hypothetical protein JWM07_236 [Candidatus Saccharibacteria bacterium]|jgi:hypothetical protein|nr:hypothetical protein [Candidatus Saccharibacteria bacterium]